jgi:hypothetical protein
MCNFDFEEFLWGYPAAKLDVCGLCLLRRV